MPILREGELDIMSHSAEQTGRLGMRLGTLLRPSDVICLCGDMGAGKTVFSAGIGRGWGAQQVLTSPTYNLVHQHSRQQDESSLYHLDCYRLRSVDEVDTIGFDDIVESGGILVIEWPERIREALPEELLWIELRVVEETRRNFVLEAQGERHQQLVTQFRASIFGTSQKGRVNNKK